jgi:membrane-associated phospholipid phosphatase
MGNFHGVAGREGVTAGGAAPSRGEALAVATGLSLLFFPVYGICNILAARMGDAGVIFAEWERRIPFVPAAIVPYWAIDLLFFSAPFLLATRFALRTHAARIVAATFLSAAFFLAFPLTFAWPRPPVPGALGFLYGTLDTFDKPHNLFPSLHVAYATILWPVFGTLRRPWRFFFHAFLVVIVASTLVTWQHHVADVVGGFALGLVCHLLFPGSAPDAAPGGRRHFRTGLAYLAGAACCAAVAFRFPAAWILAWPAFALAWVAAAYLGLGPAAFRKSGGRLSLAARILLAPVLAGSWLNWRLRGGLRPAWAEVAPGLFVGRALTEAEAASLRSLGVVRVVDLAGELCEPRALRELAYASFPVLDLTPPADRTLREAVDFLRAGPGPAYVHCAIGLGRSAAVAAAYLLATGAARTVDDAIATVKRGRPGAVFPGAVRAALEPFASANTVNPNPAGALQS